MARPVKSARRYDATGRRARAEASRAAVLDAAEELFLADGYGATSVAMVAAAAGVSTETVYKAFGTKPGIVRAIRDRALLGDGPVPAETRSDALQGDARAIIDGWATLAMEVMPRVAPILLVVRSAAAADPGLASLRDELDRDRLARMTVNARHLLEQQPLRAGRNEEHVRDVLFAYSSPELYELLVLRQGWSLERYRELIVDGMASALLSSR
jgi:AcrR family transcriptional regulator